MSKASTNHLAHYGTKGMRWGVRKAYTDRLGKGVSNLDKVASGKAGILRKTGTALGSSTTDLIRGRGVKGAAALRRDRLQNHIDRVNRGEQTAGDILRRVGFTSTTDLARGVILSRTRD